MNNAASHHGARQPLAAHPAANPGPYNPHGGSGNWIVTVLDSIHQHPLWSALLVVMILYVLYAIIATRLDRRFANPLWLSMGVDGRLSTSKFQFLIWTPVVLFVAVELIIARFGRFSPLNPVAGEHYIGMPSNVLIALGLSLTTVVGAKGIAVSYQRHSNTAKSRAIALLNLGDLISDDSGVVDLTKVQMLAWTAVAIFAFLYEFIANTNHYVVCDVHTDVLHTLRCFPDIDTALMVLMGLGTGTYLGAKLIGGPDGAGTVTSMTATAAANEIKLRLTGQGLQNGDLTIARVDDPSHTVPARISWAMTSAEGTVSNPLVAGGKQVAAGQTLLVAGTIVGAPLVEQRVIVT